MFVGSGVEARRSTCAVVGRIARENDRAFELISKPDKPVRLKLEESVRTTRGAYRHDTCAGYEVTPVDRHTWLDGIHLETVRGYSCSKSIHPSLGGLRRFPIVWRARSGVGGSFGRHGQVKGDSFFTFPD